MAIAVGDYDNDGMPDLYITGYEHNVLYHNLGGCRFEDVTEKAGVKGGGFSTGAAWADYDRDGKLDLFVARYVHTDARHLPDPNLSFGYKGVLIELPDRWRAKRIFYIAIAATERSKKFPRRRESMIRANSTAWGLLGGTTMPTAGPT